MRTIYIEAESFHGNAILGSDVKPYGYGLEHVKDVNTGDVFTIIFKGCKNYAYREREDGSCILEGGWV